MNQDPFISNFTEHALEQIFPPARADAFFEALFGDAEEGAYDIRLNYTGFDSDKNTLSFELQLHQRPGKCLACNLTYGLPEVFSRHPIINLQEVAHVICDMLPGEKICSSWQLQSTIQHSSELHVIPFLISIGQP